MSRTRLAYYRKRAMQSIRAAAGRARGRGLFMTRLHTAVFTFVTCAVSATFAAGGPIGSGQKMKPEEVLEAQTKNEQAGTPDQGRPLYEKQCASCHRFGALGKDVGPDLTTIASRFKRKDVLEAVLWPSKVISDRK